MFLWNGNIQELRYNFTIGCLTYSLVFAFRVLEKQEMELEICRAHSRLLGFKHYCYGMYTWHRKICMI